MTHETNPYLTQPNAEEHPCTLCGGTEDHDSRCPELHRCPECWCLVEGGEEHDRQCCRAGEARAERWSEPDLEVERADARELVDELLVIARAAGGVL